MMWTHVSKMYWACSEVEGFSGEIKTIDGVWYWGIINLETGEIISSGNKLHPVKAINHMTFLLSINVSRHNVI